MRESWPPFWEGSHGFLKKYALFRKVHFWPLLRTKKDPCVISTQTKIIQTLAHFSDLSVNFSKSARVSEWFSGPSELMGHFPKAPKSVPKKCTFGSVVSLLAQKCTQKYTFLARPWLASQVWATFGSSWCWAKMSQKWIKRTKQVPKTPKSSIRDNRKIWDFSDFSVALCWRLTTQK